MTIGQNLRALRKKRGLTQQQLGRLCGITGGAVSSYENGVTVPRRRVVEQLARALDVPVDRLTQNDLPSLTPQPLQESDALLYDGVLAVLKQLYGIVEGRVIVGGNGAQKKYYLVRGVPGDFVLYDRDIAAIVRSAKASMSPMVDYMRRKQEVAYDRRAESARPAQAAGLDAG